MKVTVLLPPQAGGAPPCATLLFDKTPLQPPVALAVSSQRAKALFTADWVWQAVVVVFIGQVTVTGGAAGTEKVAWQVVVNGIQVLV